MPNHVKNIIRFKGKEEDIKALLESIQVDKRDGEDEFGLGTIDFNKIIPMPEELAIEAGSETTDGIELYLHAINPEAPVIFPVVKPTLEEFDDIYERVARSEGGLFYFPSKKLSNEKLADILKWNNGNPLPLLKVGKQAIDNIIKYGYSTWYGWCCDNWGTKWNAYDQNTVENGLDFLTAWSAPHPVIETLATKWPNVSIIHGWADEDIGQNCGVYLYSGGECEAGGEFNSEEDYESAEKFANAIWDGVLDEENLL